MAVGRVGRVGWGIALAATLVGGTVALGQSLAGAQPTTFGQLSDSVWTTASGGDADGAIGLLRRVPEDHPNELVAGLSRSSRSLGERFDDLHGARLARIEEIRGELTDQLAEEGTSNVISEALKSAAELQMLAVSDAEEAALLEEPQIRGLINDASIAARRAEAAGDWMTANELFYRLNALEDKSRVYREDLDRVSTRLSMIRMYNPERFWELRNEHQIERGEDPLPAFNPLGGDFDAKLAGIDDGIVISAIRRAQAQHVDRHFKPDRPVLEETYAGGINAVRTFVTTPDLYSVFPGMADDSARSRFTQFLNEREGEAETADMRDLRVFVRDLMKVNDETLRINEEALLHEFGDGAMAALDDFSAIIWPDQMRRFERMTQGRFQGVGIQIQMDTESQMIKVVTPLEGTPAQRAGIQRDDLIKKIDGESAVGITLDQAVDQITGPKNTTVTLTVQRGEEDLDFDLVRAIIPIHSVKGWRRVGADETEWDWFIDAENSIGYVRLLQFTDDTTSDLTRAIRTMKKEGLSGLVVDLRFNPGGLLTEAVSVASLFIEQGRIVSTEGMLPGDNLQANGRAQLTTVPVAVLINEGSASASEIVSGAIRHYADQGDIRAIIVGQRSFGKGSVQNVWPLGSRGNAMMKLTTQYYKLPDGTILHRQPGARTWGIEPHVSVRMMPDQIADALKLRQDADVMPINENGEIVIGDEPLPDPDRLITDGIDLQLQTALMLLQSQAVSQKVGPQAALLPEADRVPG
jgi:carboxyl-terminal processing protease